MICIILDLCGSSVIRIIHHNAGLKCFFKLFSFTEMFVIIIKFFYIYDSQGSVKTHLRCGEIYNNRIIANSPQSVPVKEF